MKVIEKLIAPNPFRKELGNLDNNQIDRIKESFKMSDFGKNQRFEVRITGSGYQLVYGHHRLEALRSYYGTGIEVEILIRDYNDSKMLVELLRENLTREHGWNLRMRSAVLAKKYLIDTLHYKNVNAADIVKFISVDGKTVNKEGIWALLRIAENLAPDLINKIESQEGGHKPQSDMINLSQAEMLSLFKNHEEQKALATALKSSIAQRTGDQAKLITMYKTAPTNIKNKILSGEADLISLQTAKETEEESEDRIIEHKKMHEDKKMISDNQHALYIFSCLSDAIKGISKLERKRLNRNTITSLRRIYKKTIEVLTKELQNKKGL